MSSRREISPHENKSVSGSRLASAGGASPRVAPSARCCMRPPPGPNTTWMIFSSRCFLRLMALVTRDVMDHSAHAGLLSRHRSLNREPGAPTPTNLGLDVPPRARLGSRSARAALRLRRMRVDPSRRAGLRIGEHTRLYVDV